MKFPAPIPIRSILVLLAGALLAQAASPSWEAIGQIGGATQAIAVSGRFVYAGTGRRLVVLDGLNGLRELGHSQVYSDLVEGVAVQNNLAFVACGRAGVHIVDVSNPSTPLEVATVTARGPAQGVAVAGATLYVANGPYGLRLYNISTPSQPVQLGSAFPTYNVLKVAVNGGMAYLAAAGAGLPDRRCSRPREPRGAGHSGDHGFQFRYRGGWQYRLCGRRLGRIAVGQCRRPPPSGREDHAQDGMLGHGDWTRREPGLRSG